MTSAAPSRLREGAALAEAPRAPGKGAALPEGARPRQRVRPVVSPPGSPFLLSKSLWSSALFRSARRSRGMGAGPLRPAACRGRCNVSGSLRALYSAMLRHMRSLTSRKRSMSSRGMPRMSRARKLRCAACRRWAAAAPPVIESSWRRRSAGSGTTDIMPRFTSGSTARDT